MTTVNDLPDVWAVSATPRRPGELVTRGDVCHLYRDRDAAERGYRHHSCCDTR